MLTNNVVKRLHIKMRPSYWAYLNWVANKELAKRNDMLERMVLDYSLHHPYPDAPKITPEPGEYHASPDVDLFE